jgi:hypothetical protein
MNMLGTVWIGAGMLATFACGSVGLQLFESVLLGRSPTIAIFTFFWGLPLVVLGIAVFLRQMWAVRIGLVLTYIATASSLFSCNVCGLVLFLLLLMQGHRALAMAGQLTRAGIPLNTRPEDFEV